MRKIVVLALLVLVPACGGGDDSGPESRATTVPPTTRSAVDVDKERAQRIVLTAADLPGYTEDPVTADEEDDETDRAFEACMQNDAVLTAEAETNPRTAEGREFSKGDEVNVGSEAIVAETEEQAKTALNVVRQPSARNCLGTAFREELAKTLDPGVTLRSVNANTLSTPTVGDEAVGMRVLATITGGGQTIRANVDFTIIRRERAVAFLLTSQLNSPFPESERAALATKMADRMAA